jgi:hypothetical protein
MIRLARRASLLVTFSLLASAATASAECAWVLWEKTSIFKKDAGLVVSWAVRGDAASTMPGCEAAARVVGDSQPKVVTGMKGEKIATGYFCLPDTVDPRGPEWEWASFRYTWVRAKRWRLRYDRNS